MLMSALAHACLLVSKHACTLLLLCREYAQTLASHVGMLTMSQMGAAERRKEWNREVADIRATCQVKQHTPAQHSTAHDSSAQHWHVLAHCAVEVFGGNGGQKQFSL
jgi:hypothetical protein